MNDLYRTLGNQRAQRMNPMQMLQYLKGNPAQALSSVGLRIPEGMNNPQEIITHLMQTGQITQSRLSQAQRMAQNIQR